MEEEQVAHVCSLIETAIAEFEENNAGTDGASCSGGPGHPRAPLSVSILSELYDVFAERNSSGVRNLDSEFWNELAERRVCLSALVEALKSTMEKGGKHGLKAARVYLGLFLVDECPLYSLFNPLSFHVLVQCIRSCSFPTELVQQDNRGRKGKVKKGKRTRVTESQDDGMEVEGSLEQPSQGEERQQGRKGSASLQDVVLLMGALQKALQVLSLKEHPDTLKVVVELVVDLPMLMADLVEEDDVTGPSRGAPKARRLAPKSGPTSILIMSFSILRGLLEACHGGLMETAEIILRALTPSILCIQAAGSPHQKTQLRGAALEFVTKELLASNRNTFRPAVLGLARYLCVKAPEKVEARTLAVEAVATIVKSLGPSEWSGFGIHVAKLSRSKPRHRLLATDVGLALFGTLPDPFERDADADSSSPRMCRGEHTSAQDQSDSGNEVDETSGPREGNSAAPSIAGPPWGVPCIEAILHRCSDKVPTIRARALGNLGQVVELLSGNVRCRGHLQTLLGFVNPSASSAIENNECHVRTQISVDNCDTPMLGDYTPLVDESAPSASPLTPGAGHGDLGSLLRRRCLDEKAGVRKSALFLLKKSVALSGKPPDEATLQAMGAACSDPLVSIRKAALSALTEVLRKFPAEPSVSKEWLLSALPLALDNETSLQDECLDIFEEMVLDKIAAVSAIKLTSLSGSLQRSKEKRKGPALGIEESYADLDRMLPAGIFDLLKGMADGGTVASCVKRICTGLGKRDRVRPGVAIALQNIINVSRTKSRRRKYQAAPQGTWMLLAEVSAFVPKAVGWDFLRTHWRLLEKEERSRTPGVYGRHQEARSTPYSCSEANTPGLGDGLTDKGDNFVSAAWAADRVHLLQTISNIAVELPAEAVYDLASELLSHLEAFNMHPAEVAGHVRALSTLCRQKAEAHEQAEDLVSTWVKTLMKKAGDILQEYVSRLSCGNQQDPEQLDSFHTPNIGSSGKTKARIPSQHKLSKGNLKQLSPTQDIPVSTSQIVTVVFTIGAIVLACPSEKPGHIVTLLQTLVAPGKVTPVPGKQMDSDRSLFVKGVALEISVQVWVTLGKLCLADNNLAKRCIPLFIQELDRSDSAAVRNNIMIAMTDFCVRYTALVDGYIHTLTKSLQDRCELVRRQAFVLLARLLQRDYVKWRGMLFHRFLLALVDSSPKICQLASFLIGSILKVKAPLLAYNSFVETIFVLNDCHGHSGYSSALRSSESERKLFSLRGNGDTVSGKRMHIYAALLQVMAPEHVLATSAKLCTEILGGAADGLLSIADPSVQSVLQDAFRILASKEMRVASKGNAVANEGLDTEEDSSQAAATAIAAVKGRAYITQMMKKSLVQQAIPIFIELKRILESKHSPLLGMLMECLRVLLKEYKNEIEEMLVADRQLQKEIIYDMQKHEAAKARGKVAAAAAEILTTVTVERQEKPQVPEQGRVAAAGSSEVPDSAEVHVHTPSSRTKCRRGDAGGFQGEHTDKENVGSHLSAQKAAGGEKNVEEPTSSRLLRPSTVTKRTATTGLLPGEKGSAQPSPRVTWLDQTPGYIRPPDSEGVTAKTPMHSSTAKTSVLSFTPSPCIRAPAIPSAKKSSNGALAAAHLAGAVADVAAAATVTAVLKEAAAKTSTPLGKMSIPRLRTPLSAVSQGSDVCTPISRDGRRALEAAKADSQHRHPTRSKGRPPQSGSTRRTRSQNLIHS